MFLRFIIFALLGLISGLLTTLSTHFFAYIVDSSYYIGYIPFETFLLGGFLLGGAIILADYLTNHPKGLTDSLLVLNAPLGGVFSSLVFGFLFYMFSPLMTFDSIHTPLWFYLLLQKLYYLSAFVGLTVTLLVYQRIKKVFAPFISIGTIAICLVCVSYSIQHMYREDLIPDLLAVYPLIHMVLAGGLSFIRKKNR